MLPQLQGQCSILPPATQKAQGKPQSGSGELLSGLDI
jgi:hypothetical protein